MKESIVMKFQSVDKNFKFCLSKNIIWNSMHSTSNVKIEWGADINKGIKTLYDTVGV